MHALKVQRIIMWPKTSPANNPKPSAGAICLQRARLILLYKCFVSSELWRVITLSSACEECTGKAEEVFYLIVLPLCHQHGQVVLMLERRKVDGDDNLDMILINNTNHTPRLVIQLLEYPNFPGLVRLLRRARRTKSSMPKGPKAGPTGPTSRLNF